jgi:hypothetical protein
LTVNNIITTNNPSHILIKSKPYQNNGSLIFHNPEDSPVQATVEMYTKGLYDSNPNIQNRWNWQFIGIPVRSTSLSLTTSIPNYESYICRMDETAQSQAVLWTQMGKNALLSPFTGYEITQLSPKTITFKGDLVNKNFDSEELSFTGNSIYKGQHLFANPYTAAVDITKLVFGDHMDKTVYLYNTGSYSDWQTIGGGGKTRGDSPGQYRSIPINLAGQTSIPRQIPSMQAFLVRAHDNSIHSKFSIPYSSAIAKNNEMQRAPESKKVLTLIDVIGTRFSDCLWLFTDSTCTHSFDNGWDGIKFIGSPLAPQLFAMEADGNYQINTVNDVNNTELGFQAGEDTQYSSNLHSRIWQLNTVHSI